MTTTAREARPPAGSALGSDPTVSESDRRALLGIARGALRVATGLEPPSRLGAASGRRSPAEPGPSVFVTLTESGGLRGCMGTLGPDRPIEETVALTAITAALEDPRFRPVEADELPLIHVDVSILGEPVDLLDPGEFAPGVHGVIVERGGRRALLLPEVATDHGWDGARMLRAVCEKAGLPGDAWQDPRTRRLVFRTVRFGGPAVEPARMPE